MKYIYALLLISSSIVSVGQTPEQSNRHVVLISIDALRPDFYLNPSYPAPTLQKLAKEGARSKQTIPVFPSVTYPNHTSMVTGAVPARHGIYNNTPLEPIATGKWNWSAKEIKTPTLWDVLKTNGKTSAAVIWPVTMGAPITYNVPEYWSLGDDTKNKVVIEGVVTPSGLLTELEQQATGSIDPKLFNTGSIAMDQNVGRMAAYLVTKYKPAFTALHLIAVDHEQHAHGMEHGEVNKALAAVDNEVAQIIDAVQRAGMTENTTIIVTGDHGFSDIHTAIAPNVWLKEAGMISEGENWNARFHTGAASAFLYLRDPKDLKILNAIRTKLKSLPRTQSSLFRMVEKEELEKWGADPNAMLALAPVPGVTMSLASSGDAIRKAVGGTHGYLPEFYGIMTGTIFWGSGIQKEAVIPQMHTYDIAPVIAKLLGIEFASPDGVLYPGILK